MNIQIFGKAKCFDTKKAERYFKERRIKYQFVDIIKCIIGFILIKKGIWLNNLIVEEG